MSDVAKVTAISADRLAAFETGERAPSRRQAERLAETYGVPLYALFSQSPPNLPSNPVDFRQADMPPANISARGLKHILAAEKVSTFSQQISDELNFRPLNAMIPTKERAKPADRAKALRAIFDDWRRRKENQLNLSGDRASRVFQSLRIFVEAHGNVVGNNSAPIDDYLGFFIKVDSALPTTFVNRALLSKKAQLFTLSHEIGHFLADAEGISNPFITKNTIEKDCNQFAAEFLAPMDNFRSAVERLPRSTRSDVSAFVNAVSKEVLLSKHATAIRLLEARFITRVQLQAWEREWKIDFATEKEEERFGQGEPMGQPHAKRIGELGYLPVYLAAEAIRQKIVDEIDVENGIGLSAALQSRAFSLASRRFEAALS